MTPKLIKTEAEHETALAYVENLMDAEAGSDQEAELEVWGVLIEKYEEEHFPIDLPDPVAAIQFRMEQLGLTRKDLLQFVPNKSKVSEVLRRKRRLSLSMIRSIHEGLGIPTDVLIQPVRMRAYPRRKPSGAKIVKRRNGAVVSA
jgi:HTH-type transcriptional regulator/antitoxin HigA